MVVNRFYPMTMLTFANNNLSSYMSKEELRKKCPMAFSGITNPKLSDRYVHASTETVVDDLAKLGWYPVDAKQCRAKKNSEGIRSFHMIAFQNESVKIYDGNDNVDAYPRIILTNSHDGFSSFKFMVGLFRLVCSNGLVIATNKMAEICIRHINYDFEELRKVVCKSIEQVPIQVACMNEMQNTLLNDEQMKTIAVNSIKIRKGVPMDTNIEVDDTTIEEVLKPIRKEDEDNNLWCVFNRVQEHIISGNFFMKSHNKVRKQRRITSAVKDLQINRDLFGMAYSFVA